jgi:hypothetical protein
MSVTAFEYNLWVRRSKVIPEDGASGPAIKIGLWLFRNAGCWVKGL